MGRTSFEIAATGEILADAAYTTTELRRRLGLTARNFGEAIDRGLIVRALGKRRFCLGQDAIDFLRSLPQAPKTRFRRPRTID